MSDEQASSSESVGNNLTSPLETGERECTSNTTLFPASKDERYLSNWTDDVIKYESKDQQARDSKVEFLDLTVITLAVQPWLGLDPKPPVLLTEFEHLVTALKIVVNKVLRSYSTNLKVHVASALNHCLRFFSFLLGRQIYLLKTVDHATCEAYEQSVLNLGWLKANNYNLHLRRTLRYLEGNPDSYRKLVGYSPGSTHRFRLKVDELERLVGLPIPNFLVPEWFYTKLRYLAKDPRPFEVNDNVVVRATHSSCHQVFKAINLLHFDIENLDAIRFEPFPRPSRIVDDFFGKPSSQNGRTDNISLETAVKLIASSLKWLYELGPELTTILKQIRERFEKLDASTEVVSPETFLNHAQTICAQEMQAFLHSHDFPVTGKIRAVFSDMSIRALVHMYQSAMFFIIVACHGRRRNEVIGDKKDYGLYFGCLRHLSASSDDFKVDFYIEKTLQDYQEFWAPSLVVKAVLALEELSQVFRPLHTARKEYQSEADAARMDKLFQSRRFTIWAFKEDQYQGFDLSALSIQFLNSAGVNAAELFGRNKNVFRRFYCLVYVNRYDNPVMAALRQHLDHSSVFETAIYGLDPHGRAPKQKSAVVLRRLQRDEIEMQVTFSEVRSEHHAAKILDLLEGKDVGGMYSRLILKLATRLSSDAKFVANPTNVKAKVLATKMATRGFAVNEKDNGMCMAGTNRHAATKGHCSDGTSIHPEQAGPQICAGCVNLMSPEGYRAHMAAEREALLAQAKDMSLPRAIRAALRSDAKDIESYLEADARVAKGNQEIVIRLVKRWSELSNTEGV